MALAAKATVLRDLGVKAPDVIVLEKEGVAAHWDGSSGYTDGQRLLETFPEKDVGYPYQSELQSRAGPAVNERMMRFSWMSFLVERGDYSGWIDKGRPEPSHERLAMYFRWVGERCDARIERARVVRISRAGKRWRVACKAASKTRTFDGDGLVICGPGPAWTINGQPSTEHPRIFDGRDFWRRLPEWDRAFRGITKDDELSVGIVGSGGTSATIVSELVSRRGRRPVNLFLVNRDATVFTRGESFHEARLFTDPADWLDLPLQRRKEFVKRLDQGVVWHKSAPFLAEASHVHMDVQRIEVKGDGVWLHSKHGDAFGLDYVVVAMGFDARWFRSLLPKPLSKRFAPDQRVPSIGDDLAVRSIRPRLHLPMLASQGQGPGFPNLRSLGRLSDRILHPYLDN
jgi:mycobactin lysine-N-oxygenase